MNNISIGETTQASLWVQIKKEQEKKQALKLFASKIQGATAPQLLHLLEQEVDPGKIDLIEKQFCSRLDEFQQRKFPPAIYGLDNRKVDLAASYRAHFKNEIKAAIRVIDHLFPDKNKVPKAVYDRLIAAIGYWDIQIK